MSDKEFKDLVELFRILSIWRDERDARLIADETSPELIED